MNEEELKRNSQLTEYKGEGKDSPGKGGGGAGPGGRGSAWGAWGHAIPRIAAHRCLVCAAAVAAVKDLNEDPTLPFEDNAFDVITNAGAPGLPAPCVLLGRGPSCSGAGSPLYHNDGPRWGCTSALPAAACRPRFRPFEHVTRGRSVLLVGPTTTLCGCPPPVMPAVNCVQCRWIT